MIDRKKFDLISIIVMIAAVCITILFINGEALGIAKVSDEDAEGSGDGSSEYFSKSDLDGDWYTDRDSVTKITLSGSDIKVSGSGAYAYNGDVIISRSGWYKISGTLDDGSIIVDADSSSKVWILLDNADVYASDDAALRVDQADKVFLTLAEGSENRLACGDTMSDEAEEDNTDGAIFAHDDITINGSGALSIVSEYEHGIKAKDSLKICGGIISIDANADGIHVNDHFRMTDADVTIEAMDDGICSETDLLIVSGSLLINDCYEGLESPMITVLDGNIEIYPDDDGFNANGGSSAFGNFGFFEKESDADSEDDENEPCITIYGGNIKIVNENAKDADGMDSNKDIYIYGGNIFISLAGGGPNNGIDYGSESGGVCEIHGGTVISCGGSSMVEQFSETSTQASLLYNMGNNSDDNVKVSLSDENGNVLIESEVPAAFNSIQLSCPEMESGKNYTLMIGDEANEITLDSISTTVGGVSGFGNFGGGFGGGTMPEGSERPEKPEGMEMPEGSEKPDMSEGTERPGGFGGFRGRDDMNSEISENSDDKTGNKKDGFSGTERKQHGVFERDENAADEKKESVSKAKDLSEYESSVWKYIAASVIVLASAIVAARSFKRW